MVKLNLEKNALPIYGNISQIHLSSYYVILHVNIFSNISINKHCDYKILMTLKFSDFLFVRLHDWKKSKLLENESTRQKKNLMYFSVYLILLFNESSLTRIIVFYRYTIIIFIIWLLIL